MVSFFSKQTMANLEESSPLLSDAAAAPLSDDKAAAAAAVPVSDDKAAAAEAALVSDKAAAAEAAPVSDEKAAAAAAAPVSDKASAAEAAPLSDKVAAAEAAPLSGKKAGADSAGWTAAGLPLGDDTVLGSPDAAADRAPWSSPLLACLGRNDYFLSSDIEVCLLGSFAPCVLYSSNVERMGLSGPGSFANSCLPYTGLFMLGNSLFGVNCLAPGYSYPSRTALRRRFNLEGNCEAFSRSCGCCDGVIEDEGLREAVESACDFATHFFCHACALCQEGRELRRRLPHPGFGGRSFVVMMPPTEQSMGRGGA